MDSTAFSHWYGSFASIVPLKYSLDSSKPKHFSLGTSAPDYASDQCVF